ncbi:MAG: transglutaminase domain-containing protein [Terracoccus sp.]
MTGQPGRRPSNPAGSPTFAGPTPSMLAQPTTFHEKATRQLARLRPSPAHLVDAGFTVGLVALALIGFRTTFFGLGWFWVGLAGLIVGLAVTHVTATFRLPGILAGVAVALAYLLLAGPIATREDLVLGFLPSGSTFAGVAHMAVPGWKELLTALPPVDSEGPYLALPFLFGLVGAALTYGVARRWPGAVTALVTPVALLVTSLLLGTLTAAAVALQGAAFGLVAIGWAALRSNRNRPALQNGAARTTRAVTTAALLAVATVGGFFVGPHLPGADAAGRTVLRTGLTPPYDVTAFPSPLAGFRQYTEPNPSQLFTKTLLTVQGLPAGTPVRFATLDSYDGYVWGAGNAADLGTGTEGTSFRKVGRHIAPADDGLRTAKEITATVTLPAGGYSDVWLPTFGTVTGLDFTGRRSKALDDDLRFNIDTNTGVLPEKLQAGDSYTLTAYVPDQTAPPAGVETGSGPLDGIDTESLNFVNDRLDAWTGQVDGSWPKVLAIAKAMQDGAYTDGGTPGDYQNKFLAGHSLRRMTQFVKATQLAGNDEQYASALALAANRIGIPTRVVMGAIPKVAGTVKGSDVHAWVEVGLADGTWQPVLPAQFLPDRNKKPQQLIQKSQEKKTGAQVPPPAANNPPSVLQGPDQAQNATQLKAPPKDEKSPLDPSTWPDWLRWLVFFFVLPLVVLLAVYGLIRLTKWVRRRRRRTRGTTAHRVTGGWREVVDTARDLRMPLPAKGTRLEEARALELHVSGPPAEPVSPVVDGALMGAPLALTPPTTPHPAAGADPGGADPHSAGAAGAAGAGLGLVTLATSANTHVFDIDPPTTEEVDAFWADVGTARRAIRAENTFWQKVRGDVSLRTFREGRRAKQASAGQRSGPTPTGRNIRAARGTSAPTRSRRLRKRGRS